MLKLKTLIIATLSILIILGSIASAINIKYTAGAWPWSNQSEPFPWLEYLKSLPHPTGVTLTIITRHENTIIMKAKEAFLNSPIAQELGITNIVTVFAGPEQWETYIRQALEAGRPIDIAWGGGPTLFNYIDEKGYIEPLDNVTHPEFNAILYEMQKIPERIAGAPTYKIGDDGYVHWIGAAISSFGFTINHDVINKYGVPIPKKWIDLTNPEYAKFLPTTPLTGIADPTKSTSNTRMYEIILQAYGWEEGWKVLTLMAANAKIYDSSSGVRDAVIRGDIAVGITIDFYGYTAMHQNPACEYIIPENESIVNADPIAILKDTRYPVQAAAFVAWVLSEYGGQQIWLDTDINRLPINPKVFDTDMGHQRPDLKQAYETATQSGVIQFNETLSSLTERAMQFYFKATLVNAHDDLQNVWSAITQAYLNGQITKEEFDYLIDQLTKPFEFTDPLTGQKTTFTLEYAMKINDKLTEGSVYQALMSEWEDGARNRYLETYNLLQEILAGATIPTTPVETTATTGTATDTTAPTETATTPSPSEGVPTSLVVAVAIIVLAVIVTIYYLRSKK